MKKRFRSALTKKAKRGFRGYPIATLAFYGPDSERASKVAVGVIHAEGQEPAELERWFSEEGDVRADHSIHEAILGFVAHHGVRSVVMADRIIGCPHEEGVDYAEGEVCPKCPYWATRDRWSGEIVH
jgi:hypothetical protein